MKPKKKKFPIGMVMIGAMLAVIVGYYAAAAAFPGCTLFTWYDNLVLVMEEPFQNYINEYTLKLILAALFIYIILLMMYFTGQKNYMPGKEMGTAKFADIKRVNRRLADRNKDIHDPKNIVLLISKKKRKRKG